MGKRKSPRSKNNRWRRRPNTGFKASKYTLPVEYRRKSVVGFVSCGDNIPYDYVKNALIYSLIPASGFMVCGVGSADDHVRMYAKEAKLPCEWFPHRDGEEYKMVREIGGLVVVIHRTNNVPEVIKRMMGLARSRRIPLYVLKIPVEVKDDDVSARSRSRRMSA